MTNFILNKSSDSFTKIYMKIDTICEWEHIRRYDVSKYFLPTKSIFVGHLSLMDAMILIY